MNVDCKNCFRRDCICGLTRLDSIPNNDQSFPMQDGPNIPVFLAEQIYEVYRSLYGDGQGLQVIASRGGFGWDEVAYMWKKRKEKSGKKR